MKLPLLIFCAIQVCYGAKDEMDEKVAELSRLSKLLKKLQYAPARDLRRVIDRMSVLERELEILYDDQKEVNLRAIENGQIPPYGNCSIFAPLWTYEGLCGAAAPPGWKLPDLPWNGSYTVGAEPFECEIITPIWEFHGPCKDSPVELPVWHWKEEDLPAEAKLFIPTAPMILTSLNTEKERIRAVYDRIDRRLWTACRNCCLIDPSPRPCHASCMSRVVPVENVWEECRLVTESVRLAQGL